MDALFTPTDPDGRFLGEVHVVVEGELTNPAVVMIHGIPGSTRDFRYLGPALVKRGMCAVRVDMPGFGKTPASAFASTKPADRAAFVRQVLKALGVKSFAIAGHSFGGGTAILCAALFPDDVTALVCINSVGPRRHRGLGAPPTVVRAIGASMSLPIVGPKVYANIVQQYAVRGLKSDIGLELATVQWHSRVIGDLDFEELRLACRMITCPSLVVSSSNDPLVEDASSFALARSLVRAPARSHLHTKTGGHHLQKHEAPAIARWLARVSDASPR